MTKNNRLYRRTLVPEDLYVERRADRQLHQVLTHMDQPAQILVARQMGKTNLLNNAIRMAGEDDIFIYVDLTNIPLDTRLLYRSIIDVGAKNVGIDEAVFNRELKASREQTNCIPPEQEHEAELLLLLEKKSGRLVVCLDEIDALKDFQYTDRFFGFVRSTFFSRISKFDFKRLNYVLAGVMEPIEIIAREDISPFNIAKSIELDDFSFDQTVELLDKAKISWSREVLERVHYYTGGHPRMTWDVCSELEVHALESEIVKVIDVDRVVETNYFANIALPPIDGIQRQLSHDDELKYGATKMLDRRGGELNERLKKKLYLAGLISPPFRRAKHLKNHIMEKVVETQRHGKYTVAIDQFLRLMDLSSEIDNRHELALNLNNLGDVLQRQGRFDKAIETYRESLEISESLDDQDNLATGLKGLGITLQRQGRLDEAIKVFGRLLKIAAKSEDSVNLAAAYDMSGDALQRQGYLDKAVDSYLKSVDFYSNLDHQTRIASILNKVGDVFQLQGNIEKAIEFYKRSLDISTTLNDRVNLAIVLNSLGGVFQRQGRLDEALKAFSDSHLLLVEHGDERDQSVGLSKIGGVLQRQGNFDESAEAYRKSLRISEQLGDSRSLAMSMNSLGGVLQRQGKFGEAIDLYKSSCALLAEQEDARGQVMVLNSLGGVLQRQGNFDEAIEVYKKSYKLVVKQKDDRGRAVVLNSLGGAYQRIGEHDVADRAFSSSIAIGERLRDKAHLARVHTAFGKTLLQRGELDRSIKELTTGFKMDEEDRNWRGMRIVTPPLVDALRRLERDEEAETFIRRALAVAPEDHKLKSMLKTDAVNPTTTRKVFGRIKQILEPMGRPRFAFIKPDGDGSDIYFNESTIGVKAFSELSQGLKVEAMVVDTERGTVANSVHVVPE